jgi:hypothetical protein
MQRTQCQGEVVLFAIQERHWRLSRSKRDVVPLHDVSGYVPHLHQPELFTDAGITAFENEIRHD